MISLDRLFTFKNGKLTKLYSKDIEALTDEDLKNVIVKTTNGKYFRFKELKSEEI